MKYTVLCFFLLPLIFSSCATLKQSYVKDKTIIQVVDTGKPKAEAFDLSLRWMAKSFKSAKAVIEYSDKETGTINGKGTMSVPGGLGFPVVVKFAIIIDVKEGRSRLTFEALSMRSGSGNDETTNITEFIYTPYKKEVQAMISDYVSFLQTQTADW